MRYKLQQVLALTSEIVSRIGPLGIASGSVNLPNSFRSLSEYAILCVSGSAVYKFMLEAYCVHESLSSTPAVGSQGYEEEPMEGLTGPEVHEDPW